MDYQPTLHPASSLNSQQAEPEVFIESIKKKKEFKIKHKILEILKKPKMRKIIFILVILGFMLVLFFVFSNDPIEEQRKARDLKRERNLATFEKMISKAYEIYPQGLCNEKRGFCEGSSLDKDASLIDGGGWIKVNFEKMGILDYKKLPVDPVNKVGFLYKFCSDGYKWEIVTLLESKSEKFKAQDAKTGRYRVGTSLELCKQ